MSAQRKADPDDGPAPRLRLLPGMRAALWVAILAIFVGGIVASALLVRGALSRPTSAVSIVTVRPTPSLLMSVRDLARLETTELHMEKVIDLTDTQSRLFGLVQAKDALLLVAVGRATIGVDLSKLGDGDVSMDPERKVARLRLPAPELFGVSLDESATYVYERSTSLLARRNEQLESQARREAVAAIEKAAMEGDVMTRAKTQAERQIRSLVTQLGAESVIITWQ